jgi:hypothetical protein
MEVHGYERRLLLDSTQRCRSGCFLPEGVTEDLETGNVIHGIWHLTIGDDICNNGEAEILEGPLKSPVQNKL